MAMERRTVETAQTADRAFLTLDAIARTGAARATDLARATGLERRILGRLLGSLLAANLVELTSDGRYELGAQLIELGRLAERRNGLWAKAQPVVRHLVQLTKATTIIHRVQIDELVPMVIETPTDVVSVGYPQGRKISLHEGIGRAALAWFPKEQSDAVLKSAALSHEGDGWQELFQRIRASNVEISRGEILRGVTAVGSAVRAEDGHPVALVAIVAPEGLHPERFVDDVVRSAASLSATIAGLPTPAVIEPQI